MTDKGLRLLATSRADTLADLGKRVLGERLAVVELADAAPVLRAAEAELAAA